MRLEKRVLLVGALMATTMFVGIGGSAVPGQQDDYHWAPTQGSWAETQMLVPDGEYENRLKYGSQIAIDGDTLIVGTQFGRSQDKWLWYEDGGDWIYVYNRDESGRWMFTQKLTPVGPEAGDSFGYSIALDEESGVIVAGNPGYRVYPSIDHPGLQRKVDQIHIFERTEEGVWEETSIIHRPAPGSWSFGYRVAVSGHTVVSGIPPHLYIFEKVDGEWGESDVLGGSWVAALEGDTLVTGPTLAVDSDCTQQRRTFHVYKRIEGTWQRTAILEPQNETGDRPTTSASRLALSQDGKTLVMGLPVDRRIFGVHTQVCLSPLGMYNPGPMGAVGSGWIYEEIDGEWTMTADIPNPNPSPGLTSSSSLFGISVGASNDRAIFGAVGDYYSGAGSNSGAVYVYKKVLGEWVLEAKLHKQDPEPQDWFAFSVGISGDVVVAGADASTRTGSAHVFEPTSQTKLVWGEWGEVG